MKRKHFSLHQESRIKLNKFYNENIFSNFSRQIAADVFFYFWINTIILEI